MKPLIFIGRFAAGLAMAALLPELRADDHTDAPALVNSKRVGATDLAGLYVFRSPTNANNTVFVITLSPFADAGGQKAFVSGVKYEIAIDQSGSGFDGLVFRITFGPRQADGSQLARLSLSRLGEFPETLAKGFTDTNLPILNGGTFRAGLFDDPAFFDQTGFDQLVNNGPFPRPPGAAKNLYGPNANVLGIVIELPSARITSRFSTLIGVTGRVIKGGKQIDRVGRPFINKMLIPPIPRGPAVTDPNPDLRNEFNRTKAVRDVESFTQPIAGVLQGFYGRTPADANSITALFLPDFLIFQVGNPNGFGTFVAGNGTYLGNGRRLRDDVADVLLNVLTNGAISTDNVSDDNGTRITDGNMGTIAAFPYLGLANDNGSGPNEG